jgi:hypothetical protein
VARALLAGILLGVGTRYAHDLPPEWHWLAKVGVPWLLVAFIVGAGRRDAARAALDGALSLVIAIVVYYGIRHHHSPLGLWWLIAAVPGGLAFGALGALWRSRRADLVAAAIVSASLAAEALLFALFMGDDDALAAPVLFAAAAGSLVALVQGGRRRATAVALTCTFTAVAIVAEVVVIRATGYVS